jgi:hypothetical protein
MNPNEPGKSTKPSPPTANPQSAALIDLHRAHYSLRSNFHLVALCGIALAASFFIYLSTEVSLLAARNNELKNFVANYEKNFVPMAENVRTNLEAFSRANPTLAPILQKHYGTNGMSQ